MMLMMMLMMLIIAITRGKFDYSRIIDLHVYLYSRFLGPAIDRQTTRSLSAMGVANILVFTCVSTPTACMHRRQKTIERDQAPINAYMESGDGENSQTDYSVDTSSYR